MVLGRWNLTRLMAATGVDIFCIHPRLTILIGSILQTLGKSQRVSPFHRGWEGFFAERGKRRSPHYMCRYLKFNWGIFQSIRRDFYNTCYIAMVNPFSWTDTPRFCYNWMGNLVWCIEIHPPPPTNAIYMYAPWQSSGGHVNLYGRSLMFR